MEPSSAPEKPSPERPFVGRRHPVSETAIGLGIFLLVLGLFFVVQSVVFVREVFQREPSLSGEPSDMSVLSDPGFQDVLERYATNGDVITQAALWSGLAGLLAILFMVWLWKRGEGMAGVLGLKRPTPRQVLKWIGIFILLGAVLEALAWASPAFRTPFMAEVMATSTDRFMMILGVGIVAPIFEEFLLRGVAYGSLRYVMDKHYAIAITAGLFTIMHLQYEVLVMLLILPIGVVLGYARANTGSLWVPILLHVLNNLASIYLPQWG